MMDDVLAFADQEYRRIEEAQRLLEETEIVGQSRNGGVTARMRGTGQLTEVTFDRRRLSRYDDKAIGAFVVEAVNDAIQGLGEATRQAFAEFMTAADDES